MELISSVTVGAGGAANITFSAIPGTYTDLVILTSLRDTTAGNGDGGINIRLNGDSGSNYSGRFLGGTGSSTAYGTTGTTSIANNGYGGNPNSGTTAWGNTMFYIANYASNTNKTVRFDAVGETQATSANMSIVGGVWSNTAAITSITLLASTLYQQNSTAYLYGILKGSGGATVS